MLGPQDGTGCLTNLTQQKLNMMEGYWRETVKKLVVVTNPSHKFSFFGWMVGFGTSLQHFSKHTRWRHLGMPKWIPKPLELNNFACRCYANRWETEIWARFPFTKGGSSPVDFATAIRCPEVASCCASHCVLTKAWGHQWSWTNTSGGCWKLGWWWWWWSWGW